MDAQIRKGVLEGCILAIIDKGETYGYEISQKLSTYGFGIISEGTIYPLLLRLEKAEAIKAVLKPSPAGPKRKYFYLTNTGKKRLQDFEKNWTSITTAVNQVLRGEER
ncbi:PadR family transcriptional regulator PadR [Clostridiales Family XIII bacterium PM5-7]